MPISSLSASLLLAIARPHTLLSRLADVWAYASLGLSSIIIEEAAPILGGFAAYEGNLGLWHAMIALTAGSWAGSIALYFLGRWRGKWMRRRWPRLGRYILVALRYVRRRPWRAALLVRYAYGARIALPMACGAARLPMSIFLIGSAISSVLWAVPFTVLGWAFGETAVLVLGRIRRYEDYFALAIILALAVVFWVLHRQGRIERVAQQVALGTDEGVGREGPPPAPETPPSIDRISGER